MKAQAAVDYAHKILTGYGPFLNAHNALRADLQNVEKAAVALATAPADATAADAFAKSLDASLGTAIARTQTIANRNGETAAEKAKARDIGAGLRAIRSL